MNPDPSSKLDQAIRATIQYFLTIFIYLFLLFTKKICNFIQKHLFWPRLLIHILDKSSLCGAASFFMWIIRLFINVVDLKIIIFLCIKIYV
jgi:hypothetical protein